MSDPSITTSTEQDDRWTALLDRAQVLADTVLAPRANRTDREDAPPAENVRLLAEAGLLAITTPESYGGMGAPGPVVRAYTEILAGACGVTNFVQGQHISACAMIAGSENQALKATMLPDLSAGRRLCGVAFSHLRRPGPPLMRAEVTARGYQLDGSAPWFTGWGVMDEVVLGATLGDGRLLYAVVPLTAPGLTASTPMQLCAMNASGTVVLRCSDVRVDRARCMKTITREEMASSDLGAILGVTAQMFGVATAAVRLLRSLAHARHAPLFDETADALDCEIAAARVMVDEWRDRTADAHYKTRALGARAWCTEMAVRATHAAVTAVGGGANDLDNTAQRLYREAMFYTLTAQTRDVQTATLIRLAEQASRAAAG